MTKESNRDVEKAGRSAKSLNEIDLEVETDENVSGVGGEGLGRDRSADVHERVEEIAEVRRVLLEAHDNTVTSEILLSLLHDTAYALAKGDVLVRSTDKNVKSASSQGRVLDDGSGPLLDDVAELDGGRGKLVNGRGAGEERGDDVGVEGNVLLRGSGSEKGLDDGAGGESDGGGGGFVGEEGRGGGGRVGRGNGENSSVGRRED